MSTVSTPNDRSRGIVAVSEGFFAFLRFGWGQAAAPSRLTVPLIVGSAVGAIVAAAGAVVAARATGQRTRWLTASSSWSRCRWASSRSR